MNCLNLDNADVQQWIQQESLEKVYQVYVDNNYILPDYTVWKQFNTDVSMSEIETRLDAILPLYKFSIDKLSKLMNSLPISTQAAYLQNVIYLSENPKLVDVYEEGFHAIFDTLVSESEKKQLLEAAQSMLAKKLKKDGKTINQYVKEIAEKYPETYSTMSQKQKLERVFEEELAKMYVDSLQYKNPYGAEKQLELSLIPYVGASVAKTVASILSKAFDVLKSIYKMFTDDRDTISLFFKQINEGKYKNSVVSLNENSTIPTTRLLELDNSYYDEDYEIEVVNKKLFSSEETQKVIRNVGSIFFQLQNEQIKNSFNERLDESVYQYFVNDEDIDNIFNNDRTLINEKNQEAISALKEDISSYIKDFNSLVDFDSEVVESEEETQNEFKYIDTSADERNPYENSYSRQLKLRIAKAGKIKSVKHDIFIDGKQISLTFIEAVDVYKTYSALARALSNTDNGEQRWKRLMAFSNLETNSDTKAFVNQLIYDMFKTKFPKGTNYYTVITDSLNNITNRKPGFIIFPTDKEISEKVETIGTNNAVIVNSIVKGFDLWKRTNYVMTYDAVKKTAELYDANSNNVQSVQYNTWLNSIMSLDLTNTKDVPLFLTLGDKDSDQYARDIKDSFEKRGILLSKDYISYSIAKYKISEGKADTLTSKEENLINNFNLPDDLLLDTKTSNNIANINNAFKDFTLQKITGVDGKGGIKGRLKTIAEGNSYFDESIPDGTYKTADGKTKYNFQSKTFHLQRIDEILKGKGELANTIPGQDFINPEFIKDNYILQKLKTPEWQRLINNRTIFSFTADGLRQQDTLANGKKEDSDGVVAGDMSNRDFMLYLLNSAVGISEKANEVKTVPIYFGNYEASKTYEFITLPFIKDLIDNNGMLTNAGAELIETEIKKEFNRIQKEAKNVELENTYTKYNTGKTVLVNGKKISYKLNDEGFKVIDFSNYRALAFSDYIKGLIGEEYLTLPKALEDEINTELNSGNDNIVIENIDTENSLLAKALFSEYNDKGVIDSIKKSIDYLNTITVNKLKSTGAVELLDNKYSQAVTNLGFVSKNIDVNVKKVATNNLLNTMFINQLMQGDQALLYKNDGVDMFKRFKMRNAAIVSFETNTIAPKLGITETWKELSYIVHSEIQANSGIDKKPIDQADAQNYGILKYFRYAQYAMGRLNADLANLYDMIDQGEDTTSIEDKIFDMELYTPILKTVGFDGSNGVKKSDGLLSKRLTSTFKSITEAEAKQHGELVNGRWKPINGAKIETVKWSDGTYYQVIPRPEKQLLHDRRKVMEGWRFSNGEWNYTGEEIMLSMPISASKLLNRNTLSGHDLKAVTAKNINKIDLRYYGLQVETAHPHDKIPDPTQYLEIALNELKNELGTSYTINGKEFNTDELINMYQDALYQRDDIRFNELYNEIFETDEEGKITFKKEDFKAIFVRSLEASGNEKQVIELAQQGQFNNPLIRDKFISQIFSYFTKDGLSQKRKGDAAPHFSSYGMKLIKKSVKHIIDGKEHWSWETLATDSDEYKIAIQNDLQDLSNYDFYPDVDNKPHTRYTENRLQDAIKELGEGKYFIDELRHLKPRVENNKITGYFTEAVLSKYEKEQARIYDGQRYMFGVRIPSQDKHSGVNIEWVDMLPAHYGSAIAVAKEIVQLSGSDFDIDKLYISKPDGYYIKEGFKQFDNSYESYVKYQFKNNPNLKKELSTQKDGSEVYLKLSAIVKEIRLNKQVDYKLKKKNEKEIIKALGNFNTKEAKNYLKIIELTNQIESIDINQEYGYTTSEDLKLRKELQKELTYLYKFVSTTKTNILNLQGDSLKEFVKSLENYKNKSSANDEVLSVNLEPLRIELERLQNISLVNIELPSTKDEFENKFKGKYSNRGYINNLLLQANQQGLANNQTLDGKISDTPASMTYMGEGVLKENVLENGKYLLSDDGGKTFVGSNKSSYNVHSFMGHVNMHNNVNTGKKNIGADVNWMLLDIVLNRIDAQINPNNSVTIGDETYNSLELFIKNPLSKLNKNSSLVNYANKIIPGLINTKKDEIKLASVFKSMQLLDRNKTYEELEEEKQNLINLKKDTLNSIEEFKKGNKELKDSKFQMVAALIMTELLEQGLSILDVYENIFKQIESIPLIENKENELRVFDVLSTLTSSATDEAKEQLNARYGFNIDALNAVIPLVAMGGNLSLGIALVNQSIVKDFLARKAIKNNAVLTFDEKKDKYKKDEDIFKELLGVDYKGLMGNSDEYTIEDLAKGVRERTYDYKLNTAILRDYIKLTEITEYGANLIAAIKLKKGFGSDIYSFDGLLEKLNNLDVFKADDDAPSRPINIRESLISTKENKAKEIFGKLDIVSKLQGGLPKVINLKKEIFENLRASVKQETVFLNRTAQQELNNELESFIYSQLLIKDLQNIKEESYDKLILNYLNRELITENADNNIGDIFIKFKAAADKIPQLVDNPLLKKLQINKRNGVVSLTLNQLVKLNDTEMSELQDSFTYLTNFIESLEGSISPLEFTKVLQAQFIIKDGMQFKYDGISKIFPTAVFDRFGKILDDVANNKNNEITEEEQQEFINRYMTSVKHKASVKRVLLQLTKDKRDDFEYSPGENIIIFKGDSISKIIKEDGKKFNYLSIGINFGDDKIIYSNYKLKGFDSGGYLYENLKETGNSNITTMGIPVGQLVFGQTEQTAVNVEQSSIGNTEKGLSIPEQTNFDYNSILNDSKLNNDELLRYNKTLGNIKLNKNLSPNENIENVVKQLVPNQNIKEIVSLINITNFIQGNELNYSDIRIGMTSFDEIKDLSNYSKEDVAQILSNIIDGLKAYEILYNNKQSDTLNSNNNISEKNKEEIIKNTNTILNRIKKELVIVENSKVEKNNKRQFTENLVRILYRFTKTYDFPFDWNDFQTDFYRPLELFNKFFKNIEGFSKNEEEFEKIMPAYFGLEGKGLSVSVQEQSNDNWYISSMYLPDFMQNKGIGKSIIDILKFIAITTKKDKRIFLWSEKSAVKFWEKQGFSKTGETVDYSDQHLLTENTEPFEVMELFVSKENIIKFNNNNQSDTTLDQKECKGE